MKILSWLSKFKNNRKESLGLMININDQYLFMARHVVFVEWNKCDLVVRMSGGHTRTYSFNSVDECREVFELFEKSLSGKGR